MNKNENLITKTTHRVKGEWFEPFFEKLVAYKEEHGTFYGATQDKEIGIKVRSVRCAYKGIGTTKLTQEMIKKLNSIGFSWVGEKNDWFPEFYEKLIAYKEEHGTFYAVTQDKEIGNQARTVRCAYKGIITTKLSAEMIDKLNSIGFPWQADKNDYQAKWFPEFLEKLIAYKEKNGTFYGVIEDDEIGQTVSNIRMAYKGKGRTKLTPEMIEKLNEIGFPWVANKNDYQAKWFPEFFKKLVVYKEKYGTFYGITTDKEIGHKVGMVRCAYKGKGGIKLTQEMIDKLNEIDFPWVAQPKKVKENDLTI